MDLWNIKTDIYGKTRHHVRYWGQGKWRQKSTSHNQPPSILWVAWCLGSTGNRILTIVEFHALQLKDRSTLNLDNSTNKRNRLWLHRVFLNKPMHKPYTRFSDHFAARRLYRPRPPNRISTLAAARPHRCQKNAGAKMDAASYLIAPKMDQRNDRPG